MSVEKDGKLIIDEFLEKVVRENRKGQNRTIKRIDETKALIEKFSLIRLSLITDASLLNMKVQVSLSSLSLDIAKATFNEFAEGSEEKNDEPLDMVLETNHNINKIKAAIESAHGRAIIKADCVLIEVTRSFTLAGLLLGLRRETLKSFKKEHLSWELKDVIDRIRAELQKSTTEKIQSKTWEAVYQTIEELLEITEEELPWNKISSYWKKIKKVLGFSDNNLNINITDNMDSLLSSLDKETEALHRVAASISNSNLMMDEVISTLTMKEA